MHAALFLAGVMLSLAGLYAAQDAPFLAAVQVIVYTGAILMLFLFVLMLVGVDSADSLVETIRGQGTGRPHRLVVGVTNVLPKAIVHRLLQPALRLKEPVHLVCREDRSLEGFLAELAVHRVDLVLADAPAGKDLSVKLFSHMLGECGTSFFAGTRAAASLQGKFPRFLDGAPFLLPARNATLRRSLEDWFQSEQLHPRIVGEIDDSALAKALSEAGVGIFAGPSIIEAEVIKRYRLRVVGRVSALRQRFYAISAERRLSHPAVIAIAHAAHESVFRGK